MQTNFTPEQLADPETAEANAILRTCVHCGFCTATCPTYQVLGDELDSPRGRIYLIKDMLEQGRPADEKTVTHIDRCLSCLACMTTCPSGVHYMHLVDQARAYIERTYRRPPPDRALRWLLARDPALSGPLPRRPPRRAGRPALRRPDAAPAAGDARPRPRAHPAGEPGRRGRRSSPPRAPAAGGSRCSPAAPSASSTRRSTRRPSASSPATAARSSSPRAPAAAARSPTTWARSAESHAAAAANIRAWMAEVRGQGLDAIVVNTSGCGTTVKDYGHMFARDPLAADAATIAGLARDVSEVMSDLGLAAALGPAAARRLPRRLLAPARPAGPDAAEGAAQGRRLRGRRAARQPPVLRLGRHLQPAAAGDLGRAPRPQGPHPRGEVPAGDRRRQHRLHHADRRRHGGARRPHRRAPRLGDRRAAARRARGGRLSRCCASSSRPPAPRRRPSRPRGRSGACSRPARRRPSTASGG